MKRRTRRALAILTAVAVVGLADFVTRASAKEDIAEAVLQYQMTRDQWGLPGSDVEAYFLSVDGSDPSESLLRRFREHKPPVEKRSAAVVAPRTGGVSDAQTGVRGAILEVHGIRWAGPGRATAAGGVYTGNHGAYFATFTAWRSLHGWVVTNIHVYGVS